MECKRNERRNWNTKGKKKLIMHELFFNKLKKNLTFCYKMVNKFKMCRCEFF